MKIRTKSFNKNHIIGIDAIIDTFQKEQEKAATTSQQPINPHAKFLFSLDLAKHLLGSGSFHYYSKSCSGIKIYEVWQC